MRQALRLSRPASLRDLLGWADVVLAGFPRQFRYCRGLLPGGKLVLASHNVESQTAISSAKAMGKRGI